MLSEEQFKQHDSRLAAMEAAIGRIRDALVKKGVNVDLQEFDALTNIAHGVTPGKVDGSEETAREEIGSGGQGFVGPENDLEKAQELKELMSHQDYIFTDGTKDEKIQWLKDYKRVTGKAYPNPPKI